MIERKRPQGVGERLAHLAAGLVDQDRADPDPLVGDHPAGGALQVVPAAVRRVAVAQPLPALVGAAALGLGADPEDRQDLEPRLVDAELRQQPEEALLAPHRAVVVVHLGDGDHRVEAGRDQVADAVEDALEGALAADRVVGGGVVAVHRDPQVERVVAGAVERAQPPAAGRVEQQPVGQDARRADRQGGLQDRLHLRVQERLAAGEVVLLDPQRRALLEVAPDLLEAEELVGVVGRRAGDEAVGAGEVADRAADLEPEGIQRSQPDHGDGDAGGRVNHGCRSAMRSRGPPLSSSRPARSRAPARW